MTPSSRRLRHRAFASSRVVWGFVFDSENPARTFAVQLWVDGLPVGIDWANRPFAASTSSKVENRHGFRFIVPPEARAGTVFEVRLANLDIALEPIEVAPETDSDDAPWLLPGAVDWRGGLRLTGWLKPGPYGRSAHVHARIGDVVVASASAGAFTHVAGLAEAAPGFSLTLPEHFADGALHVVEIVDDSGAALEGSPIALIAFPDGLKALVAKAGKTESEGPRAGVFDQLFPQSLPFDLFDDWRRRFATPSVLIGAPVALALVGGGDEARTLASLAEAGVYWIAGRLPAASGPCGFAPAHLIEFLAELEDGAETVVFTLAGATFYPGGLGLIAGSAQAQGGAIVYGDFALSDSEGRVQPIALPAFSYERMLEQGYGSFLFAVPRAAALAAAQEGASDLISLFQKAWDHLGGDAARVHHVPGFVALLPALDVPAISTQLAAATAEHLELRGISARVTPSAGVILPAVRVNRLGTRLRASVIIPTRNRRDLLQPCIETIAEALEAAEAELIVVDNGSSDPDTLAYLKALAQAGAQVLRDEGPFNYSRLNNRAAEIATGEALVLLNNDIEALDAQWLDEMLGRLSDPDVGVVGAKLLWPSHVVQHGGVVLGLRNRADHAFTDCVDGSPGYSDLLCVAHEVSAVTGACLATRRSHYREVGGLDELHFPVNFNDVDYCLKQTARGRRVIFTPHARLLHRESASRGFAPAPDKTGRLSGELKHLRSRWAQALADDPYYSPLLALDGTPYNGLAWPPRGFAPKPGTGMAGSSGQYLSPGAAPGDPPRAAQA